MKRKRVAVIILAVAALLGLAWIAEMRIRGIEMPEAPETMLGRPVLMDEMADTSGTPSGLPVLSDRMPEFEGIALWLNSEPLVQRELRGKVVLVDFWTYSCINCIRTLPYVTSWYGKYREDGLMVIGVHTPEFAFEKDADNVRDALSRHGIIYPVALDNDYATWNNYDNSYWPAKYLFDAKGRLRYAHLGEGGYEATEKNIRLLLAEAGAEADSEMTEIADDVDFRKIGTPETYIGYGRQEFLGNREPALRDAPRMYATPIAPEFNEFYLGGAWIVGEEKATLAAAPGEITYLYQASALNLVMGAPGEPASAEVTLEGGPVPAGLRGADLYEENGRTYVRVSEHRLYLLIDARGDYARRLFKIRYLNPGVEVYAFTFG